MLWWPQNPVVWWLQSGRCSWPPGRTSPTRTKPSSRSRTAPSAQVGPNPPRGALKGLSSPQLVLSLFLSPPPVPQRRRQQQAAGQQHLHHRQEDGGGAGHALPVPEAHQRHLGAGRAPHPAQQPHPHGTAPPHPPPAPIPLGGTHGVPIGSPLPQQRDAESPQPQKSLGCSPLSPSSLPFSWLGGARCHPAVPWGLSPSLGVQPELLAPHNPPPPLFLNPPSPALPEMPSARGLPARVPGLRHHPEELRGGRSSPLRVPPSPSSPSTEPLFPWAPPLGAADGSIAPSLGWL